MNMSRIRMQSPVLALVVFYVLYFLLLFVFMLPALAAAGAKTETGFLVLATRPPTGTPAIP